MSGVPARSPRKESLMILRVPPARVLALLLGGLLLPACGYRLQGSGGALDSGEGRTLSVPNFRNESSEFRIEQRLTEAVRGELIRGTRYRVVPTEGGDLTLTGSVAGITTAPTVFTDQGRAIVYTVAVRLNVRVTDRSDGDVLFEGTDMTFRETFEVSNDSAGFVPEDAAAIERLAKQFSGSLLASLSRVLP
jgi:outer membrane lipopolysaccharide assembly protein LptE/RlpB